MKIYVSGKWEDRANVKLLYAVLRHAGHTITCDWTTHDYPQRNAKKVLQGYATDDIRGVTVADLVICLFRRRLPYRSAFIEMGAALALSKPVYVLGKTQDACIFMNHPLVKQYDTLAALLSGIGKGMESK